MTDTQIREGLPFSPSSAEHASRCPGSVTLDRVWIPSDPAERGTDVHRFALVDVPLYGRAEALARVPAKWRATCELIPESLPITDPERFTGEWAFAYDTTTEHVRFLGAAIGRNYGPLGANELAGSIDAAAVQLDRRRVVALDVKTGRPVTPARDNLQVRITSLALARFHAMDEAVGGLLYLCDDDDPRYELAEFDAFDLADIAEQVRQLAADTRAAQQRKRDGQAVTFHRDASLCRHCDRFALCPAWHALAGTLSTQAGRDAVARDMATALDAGALTAAKEISLLSKRLNGIIAGAAMIRPIPLGAGRYYGLFPGARRVVDDGLALRILREQFGEAVAKAAEVVEVSTSVGRIEKEAAAVLATEQGGAKKAAGERLCAALRTAGALVQKPTLKEYVETARVDDEP